VSRKLYGIPIRNLPEHDCPECEAKVGEWCIMLDGGIGWQHDARPPSSWEPRKEHAR
jgi:hypothetical protein